MDYATHESPYHSASELLKLFKETILRRWEDRVLRKIGAAKKQTKLQLRDSLPKFIDRLSKTLDHGPSKESSFDSVNEISSHHGEQRVTLKEYSLYEMLAEYSILREVIFEVLEEHTDLKKFERDTILRSIEEGMSEAGCRFMNLIDQREAHRRNETSNLLNSIRDYAIIQTDRRGIITEWNLGAELIIGYKKIEVLGRSSSIIFTHEDKMKNAFIEEMQTANNMGRAEDERWHIKKDGSIFFAIGILNRLYNENDEHIGYVKVLRDQTHIRFMEKELEKKRSEFEAIFNAIPDPVVVADRDRRIVACNPATFKFFNYSSEELLGETTSIFYAEDSDYLKTGRELYNVFTPSEGTMSYLATYKKKSGEIVISETNSAVLRDANRNVLGYLAIMRDITERIKADETLRQLADAMPQIVWTADKDGQIDYYNQRLYEYSGLDEETLLGEGWKTIIHPDDLEKTSLIWSEAVKHKHFYRTEFRLRGADGNYRWHLVRSVPVKNELGEVNKWYGTSTDIHDHKEAMDQLMEERELRETFVSTLSHDLRTPLTSAKLSGQLIRRMNPESDKLMKSVERIIGSIDRADSMIQNLLDANRIKAGEQLPIKPLECELGVIVYGTIEDLRHIHGDRFRILDNVNSVQGYWDPSGLRRIIENLCTNAIKYGDPSKEVTIRLEHGPDSMIKLSVHNFGKALPPEEQKYLFSPYKRARSAEASDKKGWGIGLTIVKGIISAHHGEVTLESHPEVGTTFSVILPVDFRNHH